MCFVCGRWGQFDKFKQSSNVSKKESIRRDFRFWSVENSLDFARRVAFIIFLLRFLLFLEDVYF